MPLSSNLDDVPLGDKVALLARLGWDFATETADLGDTLRIAIHRIRDHLDAEAGSIFLLDEDTRQLVCKSCAGPLDITGLKLAVDHGIVGRAITRNCLQMVRDVADDPSFSGFVDAQTGFTTRSILCAPLQIRDQALGAIEVINKKSADGLFSPADSQLLVALAALAALAIHNTRMAAALVEQERMKKELELAGEIQRSLLPRPHEADFPVHGLNVPAREVSGDFYHFFELDDGRISFCLGDVSGKGMNASLLMAKTISLFHCLAKSGPPPGALLAAINDEVAETATRGMFVTLVAGMYNPSTLQVVFANAGHQPPLLRSAQGEFQEFEAEAPPVGIFAGVDYPEQSISLAGGSLYLFTDGLTEGKQQDGSPLSDDGVRRLIVELASLTAPQRLQALAAQVQFPGAILHDDLTILVIDSTPPAQPLFAIDLPACPDCLPAARDSARTAGRRAGFDAEMAENFALAINEAVMNIIQHGYHFAPDRKMRLEARLDSEALVFDLLDHAPPVQAEKVRSRPLDEIRPGGLGVHFIRSLMDDMRFVDPPPGFSNCLRLVKNRKKD